MKAPSRGGDNMSIITIARELGAGGDEIASELSNLTGYRFVDRSYVEKRLNDYGITQEKRKNYDEKRPGFWSSLSQSRDDYLHFLKTIIISEAINNNCVFIGRGAYAILGEVPGVVTVKLIAPKHIRVDRIKTRFSCGDKEAVKLVEQSDRDREGYHKYFFGTEWSNPMNYMLVLNSGHLSALECAKMIKDLSDMISERVDPNETGRRLSGLKLSQEVLTQILYAQKIPIQFLEADVQDGVVTLHGVAASKTAIDSAIACAHEVAGVNQVISEIQVIQDYSVMP
jgi:cytidylate kinase